MKTPARKERRRLTHWAGFALAGVLFLGGGASIWWVSRYAGAVRQLARGVGDTVFYSSDGRPWFRLDEERHDVPLEEISPDLQHAVIAVEDRRFYLHPGIDPVGLARAIVRDVRQGGAVEGGSTLTQQLARTVFLSNVRTFGRKAKEAAIALLIEAELGKSRILELYLNRIYLSAGVYGVETMSEHMYRKPARALTLPEAALIAALIRAPSALSPWSNYDGALGRSHLVLAEMRAQGFISAGQEAAARAVRPPIQPYRTADEVRGAWAKGFLRQQFRDQFGGDHPADWQVHTSFSPALQEAAERAVAAGLQRLNRARAPGGAAGSAAPGSDQTLEAALVAVDPSTGDILAMVGGANHVRSSFNRATRAMRQPGSAFKPVVYAAALDRGYSPVSVLSDLGRVSAPGDADWTPRNAGEVQPNALTLRAALMESNNAAAAQLQQLIGTAAVLKTATSAGLTGLPDVPSLALGTGVVSPLDLVAAYTMFPGGGEMVRPRGLIGVLDAGGEQVLDRPVERERVISAPAAFQMVSMLRDVVDRGTGAPARELGVQGPVAGKTGTTDDYHDAWFVGFSSSVVVGVWVGFDKPAAIGTAAYGARVALPIWADFMMRTAATLPAREFAVPPGIRAEELCHVSYLRPVDGCPTYTEYFKDDDTVPTQLCPIHQGSLKQQVTRAVGGIFRSLGAKISGIFRH